MDTGPAALLAETLRKAGDDGDRSFRVELTHLVAAVVVLRMCEVDPTSLCLAPSYAGPPPAHSPNHDAGLLRRREVGAYPEVEPDPRRQWRQCHPIPLVARRRRRWREECRSRQRLRLREEVSETAAAKAMAAEVVEQGCMLLPAVVAAVLLAKQQHGCCCRSGIPPLVIQHHLYVGFSLLM